MKSMRSLLFASILAGIFAAPANATCMMNESPMANSFILLISPSGKKPVIKKTASDGIVRLTKLKVGTWKARFTPTSKAYSFSVGIDGKLSLQAVQQTTQCHAPPNPNAPPPAPPTVQKQIKQVP